MAPKKQLEKSSWSWAETTDPDVITANEVRTVYRLTLPLCKGNCRRNCAGLPFCLSGLGERDWLQEIDDSAWHDVEDPNSERRKEGAYVGLKNLGATCYANTFLQVWFHNRTLREAIFKWRDRDLSGQARKASPSLAPYRDSSEACNGENKHGDLPRVQISEGAGVLIEDKLPLPTSAGGHLQLLFALLQFSNRRYIDPSLFIKFLGLDAGVQQDAQEFSKLLLTLLEDTLCQQEEPQVRFIVQNEFRGIYDYVTRCSVCTGGSERPSQFYELDLNIKGHKELAECIGEFLEQEKLEGDNQYFCENCGKKQNATRCIQLRSLPRVLNVQLLRFVFDRKTGHKKKLNTFIHFPEELDMSQYVGKPDGQCLYDLTSVLIHRGPSAYSGHYIAHIQDCHSGTWYKFNDEEIEKMGGKNLQLGNEDEIDGGKSVKKPRVQKGYHCSRNAYMLVYTQRKEEELSMEPISLESLPAHLQAHVRQDRQQFEDWVIEMGKMREQNISDGKARQQEITQLYGQMKSSPDGQFEFIETKWLKEWLQEEQTNKCVDNMSLLCPHSRLDPDKMGSCKCISQEAADLIYAKYNGGPRLKSDALCWDCVRERCRVLRTKARVKEDSKLITELLRVKEPDLGGTAGGYWVGKDSVRCWKRLVNEQIEDPKPVNGTVTDLSMGIMSSLASEADGSTNPSNNDPDAKKETASEASDKEVVLPEASSLSTTVSHDDKSEPQLGFNKDLLCDEHGNLSSDVSCRRLVSEDAWRRFRFYFPNAPEFTASSPVCEQCIMADAAEAEKLAAQKLSAQTQKTALSELYFDKHRPTWSKTVNELCIIQQHVIAQWKNFVKDPTRFEPLETLGNETLLCCHGGFLFDPSLIGQTDATLNLAYVRLEEWDKLRRFVKNSVEIRISKVEEECGTTFLCSPDTCTECSKARYEADFRDMMNYKSAVVYVRKLTEQEKLLQAPNIKDCPEDPEFVDENGKRKLSSSGFSEKIQRTDFSSRRSIRHRRVRGEKEVTVCSTQTLWDFKIELMKLFSAAPMDQHLLMNGEDLVGDNKATLASLNISPGAIIYLKIDEPSEDPVFLDDATKAQHPETGFAGTGLLGR